MATSLAFVDPYVGGECFSEIDGSLETVLDWCLKTFGQEQIVKAKEDFFGLMGKIFPDEPQYHPRMTYFIDYFIFQRLLEWPSPDFHGLTPFQAFSRYHDDSIGTKSGISNYRHGLFEITKADPDKLLIVDLIVKQRYQILRREQETFQGISKKTIFQGFLYMKENSNFLSRGMVFHPDECAKAIKRFMKTAKNSSLDEITILAHLARLQLKHIRHPRLKISAIYAEERR